MVTATTTFVLGVLAVVAGRVPSEDPSGTQWAYVWLGWGVAAVAIVAYAAVIIWRGRALSKRVPPEERRWM